ncbi:MAG: hypothetical protein APR63_13240, partial [Desulfuromonas sp. SDB]
KNFGIKCVFSPPPGSAVPYLGPILSDYNDLKQSKKESILKAFQKSIDDFIFNDLHANLAMISLVSDLDPRPFIWNRYDVQPLFDYIIDLTQGADFIWSNIDKDARDHIKKVLKLNTVSDKKIFVRDGTKEDLTALLDIVAERYAEQNRKLSESKEYLEELFDAFSQTNKIKLFIVEYNGGDIINGIVGLVDKNKIIFWIGALRPKTTTISSNELLHWEAINWACENNIEIYEEIGANLERLCRSKSKYNPRVKQRFVATKYSSMLFLMANKIYISIVRPLYGRIYSAQILPKNDDNK